MIFKTVVPILYARDVAASLAYYSGVLGFESPWEWGNPPTFGGVCKDSVEVFFCKEGQGHPGTWMAIMVDKIDEYFEAVKSKGAKIVSQPETTEWGIREFHVEDPNGHVLRFGQTVDTGRQPGSERSLPDTIHIVEEPSGNPAVLYSVVATDIISGQRAGSAQILGDNEGFFYIKDVFVRPEWRGRCIGKALMQALSDWLDKHASGKASVWLNSAERLSSFYKQFGFVPVFGMARFLNSPGTSA